MSVISKLPLIDDANLQSYYPFDVDSNDDAGAINGSNSNITYSKAKYSSGAVLNGTNGAINFGDHHDLNSTDFSISFWLNANSDALGTARNVMSKGTSSGAIYYWRISLNTSNTLSCVLKRPSVGGKAVSMANLPHGEWVHIAWVVDYNSSEKLYVNGELKGTTSLVGYAYDAGNADNFYVGRSADSTPNEQWMKGIIDDLAIFNRIITVDEINTMLAGHTAARILEEFM